MTQILIEDIMILLFSKGKMIQKRIYSNIDIVIKYEFAFDFYDIIYLIELTMLGDDLMTPINISLRPKFLDNVINILNISFNAHRDDVNTVNFISIQEIYVKNNLLSLIDEIINKYLFDITDIYNFSTFDYYKIKSDISDFIITNKISY